jgi:tRNA (Thr-GGU) A37 N-methylase
MVGIFAQRPKARPNRLGLSRCQILKREGMVIKVVGLDAINGSPVLDIKPYCEEFDARGPVRQPAWIREIMANYY